jgi:hypothetical protein
MYYVLFMQRRSDYTTMNCISKGKLGCLYRRRRIRRRTVRQRRIRQTKDRREREEEMLQRGRKREGGHDGEVCPGVDRPLLSRDGKWDDGGRWDLGAVGVKSPRAPGLAQPGLRIRGEPLVWQGRDEKMKNEMENKMDINGGEKEKERGEEKRQKKKKKKRD